MCIICVKEKGIKAPNKTTMQIMWTNNPHGAGYMFYRDGRVHTRKGFMKFSDFWEAIASENFTDEDVIVYHFRISTQGGVNPEMTQPFFYTKDIVKTKILTASTKLGICHNGIIPLTTCRDPEYSDTAHFVAEYLPLLIKTTKDIDNDKVLKLLGEVLNSKMVFLDFRGNVTRIGNFIREKDGLIYSNNSYKSYKYTYNGKNLQTIL